MNTRRTENEIPIILDDMTNFELVERAVWDTLYPIVSIAINQKKVRLIKQCIYWPAI